MDPQRRSEWADAWSKWVKPGGVLVTLMFPVEPEGREGPPWPVSADLYHEVLDPKGTLGSCLVPARCSESAPQILPE